MYTYIYIYLSLYIHIYIYVYVCIYVYKRVYMDCVGLHDRFGLLGKAVSIYITHSCVSRRMYTCDKVIRVTYPCDVLMWRIDTRDICQVFCSTLQHTATVTYMFIHLCQWVICHVFIHIYVNKSHIHDTHVCMSHMCICHIYVTHVYMSHTCHTCVYVTYMSHMWICHIYLYLTHIYKSHMRQSRMNIFKYVKESFICTLQHTTIHWNTLQHTKIHGSTRQHTATRCNTLQRTASHCNTLQHTVTHCDALRHTAIHCITLHHTATHCNTLQHTATHTCMNRYSSSDGISDSFMYTSAWFTYAGVSAYMHLIL